MPGLPLIPYGIILHIIHFKLEFVNIVCSSSCHLKKMCDPVYIFRGSQTSISCCHFCYLDIFGEVLISGSHDGILCIWNLSTKRPHPRHKTSERDVAILNVKGLDGKQLVSQNRNGDVKIWDVLEHGLELSASFSIFNVGFCPIQVIQADDSVMMVYASSSKSQVTVYDPVLKCVVKELNPETKLGMVMHIKSVSKEGMIYIFIGYEDGSVYLWNAYSGEVLTQKRIHTPEPVMCLDVDSKCEKMITGSANGVLVVTKICLEETVSLEEYIRSEVKDSPGFGAAFIRDDCRIVAVGSWNGDIHIYGWKKMKALAILKYHKDAINSLSFSSTKLLAAGCKDGRISLWNVYQDT